VKILLRQLRRDSLAPFTPNENNSNRCEINVVAKTVFSKLAQFLHRADVSCKEFEQRCVQESLAI
jgi:hypothetical protein